MPRAWTPDVEKMIRVVIDDVAATSYTQTVLRQLFDELAENPALTIACILFAESSKFDEPDAPVDPSDSMSDVPTAPSFESYPPEPSWEALPAFPTDNAMAVYTGANRKILDEWQQTAELINKANQEALALYRESLSAYQTVNRSVLDKYGSELDAYRSRLDYNKTQATIKADQARMWLEVAKGVLG